MAKIIAGGVDGQQSGKLGEHVYQMFRGAQVSRIYRSKIRNPRTSGQLKVRMVFKRMQELIGSFADAIAAGYTHMPQGLLDGRNLFFKKNYPFVNLTNDGVMNVDFDKLQLTNGKYKAPAFKTPKMDGDLLVDVTFPTDTLYDYENSEDKVYIVVYQTELEETAIGWAKRSTGKVSVTVPASWSGTEVHVYGFVVYQGHKYFGRSSASAYLGKGSVE